MKRVLVLASVASMIDQFNMPNIELLQNMGYQVDVACNFEEGNSCSEEKLETLKRKLEQADIQYFQIDFSRKMRRFVQNGRAYCQVKQLLQKNQYEFLHCQSPIGGVVGRVAGKRTGTKAIYTAHGFHFYKGAAVINWLIYYPVEKFLSRWTDILITINQEDYQRAQDHFHMEKLEYIPGVGVDNKKFSIINSSTVDKRAEQEIPNDAMLLLSVGELNANKNHAVVIQAMAKLDDLSVHYAIVGQGELKDSLIDMADQLGLSNRVHLLGYQSCVEDWYCTANVFVHPSLREGLGIAPLEAMASGLPIISSYVGGMKDYTQDGITGCCIKNPKDVEELAASIIKMKNDKEFRIKCSHNCTEIAKRFDVTKSEKIMAKIYGKDINTQDGS